MGIFAPSTLQQKDAIKSRRVVVTVQVRWTANCYRLPTVGTKSPLKKYNGKSVGARCCPEIKFEQIYFGK